MKDQTSIDEMVATSQWATTIGNVCDEFGGEVQTGPFGSQLHASDYSEGGTPVVMPQDMHDGRIVCNRIVRVGPGHVARLKRHVLQPGDIVFSRRGDVTRFAVVTDLEAGWLCGTGSIRIRLNCPQIEVSYVRRYLQQEAVGNWLKHYAKGVTMPNLNTELVRALPFIYPPLDEQRRIAGILDRADELRAKRRAALAQLDELTQAIFLDMFGDPVANPKEWKTVRFEDLCDRVTVGIVVRPSSYYVPAGVPALRSLNVKPGKIVLDDVVYFSKLDNDTVLKKTRLHAGDLVLVRTGQPGTAAVVPPELDGVNAIDLLISTPRPKVVSATFLCEFFNSAGGRDLVLSAQRGQVQKHLNVGSLVEARIPLPPFQLQHEFARRVTAVETLKTAHRASLAELDALFTSLQHRAFRGEL